jgi:hypothetical protein
MRLLVLSVLTVLTTHHVLTVLIVRTVHHVLQVRRHLVV